MSIETDIKNYYEDLVVFEILRQSAALGITRDEYDDVACVALNKLPPRYYRHSVDIAFYISETEASEIEAKVAQAVADAAAFVRTQLGKKSHRA
jgi:hypothetical protein